MRLPKNWQSIKGRLEHYHKRPRKIFCDDVAPASGRVNVYICEKCRRQIWTRHVDDGVTPFMIECIHDKCNGFAQSCFYPADAQDPWRIDAVWKKEPNNWWGNQQSQEEHSRQGGVFLYWLRHCNQVIKEPTE